MKKITWGIVAVLVLVLVLGLVIGFKMKVDNIISSKIDELNNNGFLVKHQQSTNYLKTNGKGDVEVVYPDKVASYLIANIKNQQIKELLQKEYSLLETSEKELFFEGIKFDYDFVVDNINTDVNINVYLTNLSKKVMYNLNQDSYNQTSRWLLEFLNDKKLKVSFDRFGQFKLADIDTVIPNKVFITVRGLEGNGKNLRIPLLKLSNTDSSKNGLIQLENTNIDYESNQNKEVSKSTIENISIYDLNDTLNIRNLVVNSVYEKDEVNIKANSEISFDEVVVKNYDEVQLSMKNSSLSFDVNNLPIKKLDEITYYLENEKFDEYIKAIAQSGIKIQSFGKASKYEYKSQKLFDTLKYELSLSLNSKEITEEPKGIKEIFESMKLIVDLDEDSALIAKNLINFQLQNDSFDFTNSPENLKRFEAELKDGVYVNGKKVLEEQDLLFATNEKYEETPSYEDLSKGIFYEYKFLENDFLQLDIKYATDLNVVSSGGISVSFPQFSDTTRIGKYTTNSFAKVDFYPKDSEIWNVKEQKYVKASYLLVEGWDEQWKNAQEEKSISLLIDIRDLDTLVINLRAGALNELTSSEKPSEIVPEYGDMDQQDYPIERIEIPLK